MSKVYPKQFCRVCNVELTALTGSLKRPNYYRPDCKNCRNKKWREDHPSSRRRSSDRCATCGVEITAQDRAISPDCNDCHNAHRREMRQQNLEAYREYDRKNHQQTRQQHSENAIRRRRAQGIPPPRRVDPNDTRTPQQRHYDNNPGAKERKQEKGKLARRQKRRDAGILPRGEYCRGKPVSTETPQERRKRYRQNYKEKHPERYLMYSRNGIARLKHEDINFHEIHLLSGDACYICLHPLLPTQKQHIDHIIPLSRGGTYTSDNLRYVHAICNRRKHVKLLSEMTAWQRRGP